MRFSGTAERLLVAAVVIVAIAIMAGIVTATLRARNVQPAAGPSRVQHPTGPQALPLLTGTTLFWLDFLTFGKTSLPVGAKPSVPTIDAGVPLQLSGWAVDARSQKLAAAVFAQIDSGPSAAMNYDMPRPDVAKHFHQPAYALAGFRGLLPTNHVSAGEHSIFLDIINNAGKAYYRVDTHQRIVIRNRNGG